MKLINEKGKLFGIINLVDLACILIVLLLVVGVGWNIFGNQVQEVVSTTTTMTTTLRIRGTPPYLLESVDVNELVGEQLVMGSGYVSDAYITDVWLEPYVMQTQDSNGVIHDAQDPSKMDVMIVIESEIAANSSILKIGTQEVRAGRTFLLKTRTFEKEAHIDSVIVNE